MLRGIQQIQLRSSVKNQEMAEKALAAVKGAGFEGIELNRFMTHRLPFAIRVFTKMAGMAMGEGGDLPWKEMVQEAGLHVISLHTDLGTLEKNAKDVFREADENGTENIVLTGMYHYDYSDDAQVTELIRRLNAAGAACSGAGFHFLYHNHNCEFLRIRRETCPEGQAEHAGKTAYERIVQETDPALVSFEFDCYWPAETGADPCRILEKLGERQKLVHLCDRGARPKGMTGSILKSGEMELGTGNMNLDGILGRARKNGCTAAVLEQHQGWIGKDAIRSLEISGKWLQSRIPEEVSARSAQAES